MDGTVLAMLAALPLWVAMLRAWNRKDVERFSPVQSAILEPISCMNLRPIGAHEPRVSTATAAGGRLISKGKNSKAQISKGLNARHCYSKWLCFQGLIFPRGIISKWIDLQGFKFARYSCFQGPTSKPQFPRPNLQAPISKAKFASSKFWTFTLKLCSQGTETT